MNKDFKELIGLIFDGYQQRKKEERLYNKHSNIPEQIILLYYRHCSNSKINDIYDKFKKAYIYNESRIDETISDPEKEGLVIIYDYIKNYDFSTNDFDIFLEGFKIHNMLYSKCPFKEYGGMLRSAPVILKDTTIEVPQAEDARKYFRTFFRYKLPNVDMDDANSIFDSIISCIYITTELMRNQPFYDGNKRTFRALLNLMFKRYNLPPVYIDVSERKEYKDALLKAMTNRDYTSLIQFYYYKICDSIYELDIFYENEKDKMKEIEY